MSDAKPYTRDELAYWEGMSEAQPVNHRARLRVTVEALEKAEAERDEWKRAAEANMSLAERNADTIDRLCDERDEARAEVARLQDLHTRCAAFDDQPGPSCVRLAAEVARLRELVALLLPKADAFWRSGETRPPWMAEARAALKDTP